MPFLLKVLSSFSPLFIILHPPETNVSGDVEFYWVPVSQSTDYADFYYLSAFTKKGDDIDEVSIIEVEGCFLSIFFTTT